VVFHTGEGEWCTNRPLADLIAAPEPFQVHIPSWQPLFWDLSEHMVGELENAVGAWMKALAVVRAEREESAVFQAVFSTVLRGLEPLSRRENVRWHDLVRFVLSWAFWRRPGPERQQLVEVAQRSQSAAARRREIQRMSETIVRTWPEELFAEGEAHGQLRNCRENLLTLLVEKFGAVPEELAQRIDATQDLERLKNAVRQVLHIQALTELDL
jgi:hypothetical protein